MVKSDLRFGAMHLLQLVCQLKYSQCVGASGKLACDFASFSSLRGIGLHSTFVFSQRRMRATPLVTTLAASFLLCFILCSVSVSGFTCKPPTGETSNTKSCYLCLHLNESAPTAKTAPAPNTQHTTAVCAAFSSKSLHDLVFPCPTYYVECFQQTNDANSIGSCPLLSPNNCKIENYVKFCYCPDDFCNLILSDRSSEPSPQSSKLWRKEETDDEDLFGPTYPHMPLDHEKMQGDYGSGDHPPGVIRIETTTIKPTLVPNLRADSRTTPAPTTSVASSFRVSIFWSICLVLYIYM